MSYILNIGLDFFAEMVYKRIKRNGIYSYMFGGLNMLNTNDYGTIIRALRKKNGENLNDMSKKLGVSIAFLSALEVGKKTIPLFYCEKISKAYGLTEEETIALANAIDVSNKRIIIELVDKDEKQKKLCLALARKIDELSNEKMDTLIKILSE